MVFPDSMGVDDALHCTELCTLDGVTYVAIPAAALLPDQPPEITIEPVDMTPELREQIKAASPHCALIAERMESRIRSKYSQSDEAYFARIGVGAALGVYTFEPGEQDEMLAFGAWVEAARQWGRDERAKLGL
ncbi:MAG: hypothetical protein ABS55_01720 [Lautropia sp. SCN 70-15]|nr:MAG: hypothetical protein ABS55_01720 [Lautropia sp. SCN 70-15]